jgi:ribosome-binding ATPase YchF (GTP1/OBG family)
VSTEVCETLTKLLAGQWLIWHFRAETVAYDDFLSCGGEKQARDAGKLRAEGKEYVVAEGDILNFRFNV